jgi:Calcineurin-like phosphoesterase
VTRNGSLAHFLVWSDLHVEHTPFDPPPLSALPHAPTALLVAGDTDKHGRHVAHFADWAQRYGCPVVAIDGNHEPFFRDIDESERAADAEALALRMQGIGVHILRAATTTLAGCRIVGTTLWTDFALYGTPETSARIAATAMNDHQIIRQGGGLFTPQLSLARHQRERAFLLDTLRTPHAGPTIVMTHHLPRPELGMAIYAGNPRGPAFANDLRADIDGLPFDAWIYGHTHGSDHGRVWRDEHGRAYLFNARGDTDPNPDFDPTFMWSVG